MTARVGVVVIGRNEGLRLDRCLRSLINGSRIIVYVDSGSTDGSTSLARSLGVYVLDLDLTIPFTAARARNAGRERLLEQSSALQYVQFVDGDCEVDPQWIARAEHFLDGHADVAVVCGRRRERHPEASIFNALCDIEWNTPPGEALYCGGDALMRMEAVNAVHGFRADLIAGEEPELCVRLRAAGWRIWRLDAEMTLHDAAMLHLSQWWNRAKRAGYAFAHGAYLHGAPPARHWVREVRSAIVWGGAIPLLALVVAWGSPLTAVALLAVYPLQIVRLASKAPFDRRTNWYYAGLLVLGKFPEFFGVAKFWTDRLAGRRSRLIEYK